MFIVDIHRILERLSGNSKDGAASESLATHDHVATAASGANVWVDVAKHEWRKGRWTHHWLAFPGCRVAGLLVVTGIDGGTGCTGVRVICRKRTPQRVTALSLIHI